MHFYIATAFERKVDHNVIRDALCKAGHLITHDWTPTGLDANIDLWASIAVADIRGVLDADVLIVLLPGQRGTHAEMGAALAAGIPVVIIAPRAGDLDHPFYFHPGITRFLLRPDRRGATPPDYTFDEDDVTAAVGYALQLANDMADPEGSFVDDDA